MTIPVSPRPLRLLRLLSILFLSALAAACAASGDSRVPERIGTVMVRAGDDPLWSRTDYDHSGWERRPVQEADSQGRIVWVRARFAVGPRHPDDRPLAVHVGALAAYEVFWNGRLIGRSGLPGASPAAERQGGIEGHFPIPPDLLRSGDNLLAMRLSSFHLPLRVKHSLLHVAVGDYQSGSTEALRTYAAAIGAAGVLLLGGAYFGFAFRANRSDRPALLLALLSLTLLSQLALEVSRAFIGYPYGLHLWRMGAIFVLSSLFGLLLVAYVRVQFRPEGGKWLIWTVGLWCPAAFFLFYGFDQKIYAVILGSAAAAGAAVAPAALKGSRAALLAFAGMAAMALPLVGAFPAFLDQDFYIIASALIAGLCLHRALARPLQPAVQAAPAETGDEDKRLPVLTGRGVELCDPRTFLLVKGADDYAEILLAGGRTRLHRGRLSELEARLPRFFLRVHRSYLVNMDRALELSSASGSLRIRLEEGAWAPVSRSYSRSVRARFGHRPGGPAGGLQPVPAAGE
ncbi:MAG TPA: LytTR family DNA-binding domain-containing protein [Allosphingosinicella sp.]|jgi:hypothetical protein